MQNNPARSALSRALAVAIFGMAASTATAQEQAATPAQPQQATAADQVTELDRVQVKGFRRSIQYSTEAKRDATGFTDSIFAEDIGKFPDMNIAESLARVPGIQLDRDVNGDPDRALAAATAERVGMPWRSLWDGPRGTEGPAATAWRVATVGWPSVFVIDERGRIRAKLRGHDQIERELETVLSEQEGRLSWQCRARSRDAQLLDQLGYLDE